MRATDEKMFEVALIGSTIAMSLYELEAKKKWLHFSFRVCKL
jgi:hypothetical protein